MKHLSILFLLLPFWVTAQNSVTGALSFEQYMNRVTEHHPLAVQADLSLIKGDAAVRKARGGFDPKLFSDVSQKYFSDRQYYSLSTSGVKIPTWYGIELEGGYFQNQGPFLNPQATNPVAGLWQAGISVPVGKGLFIDQRRAQLKQAQIYQESTAAERQVLYNELLLKAGKAYWEWFESYHYMKTYEEAVTLTGDRYQAVKQSVAFGDKPPIDTVEAAIQFQNRQLAYQEAQLNFKNATLQLSMFLWENGETPLEVNEQVSPMEIDGMTASLMNEDERATLDSLTINHPMLMQYEFKLQQLGIEKRLKQEQLKPQLNLKYNAINEPAGNDIFAEYIINNYTWGLSFSMPIFLRKERGDLRLTKLKIQDTELELLAKRTNQLLKLQAAINTLDISADQMNLYERTVSDYARLLDGERKMFNAGESSLFMVNSRETGYIATQLKYIQLVSKNKKAALNLDYVAGSLNGN